MIVSCKGKLIIIINLVKKLIICLKERNIVVVIIMF